MATFLARSVNVSRYPREYFDITQNHLYWTYLCYQAPPALSLTPRPRCFGWGSGRWSRTAWGWPTTSRTMLSISSSLHGTGADSSTFQAKGLHPHRLGMATEYGGEKWHLSQRPFALSIWIVFFFWHSPLFSFHNLDLLLKNTYFQSPSPSSHDEVWLSQGYGFSAAFDSTIAGNPVSSLFHSDWINFPQWWSTSSERECALCKWMCSVWDASDRWAPSNRTPSPGNQKIFYLSGLWPRGYSGGNDE